MEDCHQVGNRIMLFSGDVIEGLLLNACCRINMNDHPGYARHFFRLFFRPPTGR